MWIKNRLREIDSRPVRLAEAMGIPPSRVHEIVRGTRQVKPGEWEPMARHLQISLKELGERLGDKALQKMTATSSELVKNSSPAKPEVEFSGLVPRGIKDLPVYGSAEGGDGIMVLDNDPIEYIERPPELAGVKSAYAIYVRNDSMYPLFEPGDKALIHPGKPVLPGKDALFISEAPDGTRHALIKRLVRAGPKSWKVRQFNPQQDYELPKSKWQTAQRIVGVLKAD